METLKATLKKAGGMSGSLSQLPRIGGGIGTAKDVIAAVTDRTLTIEGRAADAKVTGDRLSHVEEKIEHLETEVGDASLLLSLI